MFRSIRHLASSFLARPNAPSHAQTNSSTKMIFLCPAWPEHPSTGGEIFHRHLVEGLRRKGWDVEVITLQSLEEKGDAKQQLLRRLRALQTQSKVLVYDSWFYEKLWSVFGLLRAQGHWRLLSLSQLCYWENYKSRPSRFWHWLRTQATLRAAHAQIGVSQAVLESDLFGMPSSTPQFITYTGCDYAEGKAHVQEKRLYPKERESYTIISVGNYAERKGFHFLLEALHLVHQTTPSLRGRLKLQLVGNLMYDKAYVAHCRKQITAWGLEKDVEMHGWKDRDALQEMYEKADLFALASQGEGFGMVVLEAMYHGLPVLLGDFQTAFELLGDTPAGWVVPRDKPTAYARQFTHFALYADHSALRDAAFSRAHSFGQTWEDTTQRFLCALPSKE